MQTPMYRRGKVPASVAARRGAFVGVFGLLLNPTLVLGRALQGHSGTAVDFRFHDSFSNVVFHSGAAPDGERTVVTDLHNGWTVRTLGSVASGDVVSNAVALALLIAGSVLSLLLGTLVFVLATGRARALRLVGERTGELRHQALEGLLQPGAFIPILEQTGQIRDVGRWVVSEACRQMAVWHAQGDTLDISVNISARQLGSDTIVDDVRDALQSSGLTATSLILEVTETALMRNAEATARRLHAVKALGVRIAVDDFGTGYSSLSYLQQFPVDSLKIDRSFTSAIAISSESKALIGTLVQLGKDLGLTTLAEGVETAGQMDHLRGEHVNEAQGFLFSRPLDPETLEAQLLVPMRPRGQSSTRP